MEFYKKDILFKNRKHNKGIIQNILDFIGIVKYHIKGTLHFHLVFIRSIHLYFLEELDHIKEIYNKFATILDYFS